MLLAPPVVIIDWLITFVLKRSSLLFHSLGSSRFIYGPEPSLPLDFLLPFLFVGTPSSLQLVVPPSPTLDLFLSSIPLPLLLGKASVLTDGSSSLPVGALGPLK